MHPHLDYIDELIRVFGWPALLAALVWAIRKYDQGTGEFKVIMHNTETAVKGVAEVKTAVDLIQTNHMVHLQAGIDRLAISNDAAVAVLQSLDKNIAVLVDRGTRV